MYIQIDFAALLGILFVALIIHFFLLYWLLPTNIKIPEKETVHNYNYQIQACKEPEINLEARRIIRKSVNWSELSCGMIFYGESGNKYIKGHLAYNKFGAVCIEEQPKGSNFTPDGWNDKCKLTIDVQQYKLGELVAGNIFFHEGKRYMRIPKIHLPNGDSCNCVEGLTKNFKQFDIDTLVDVMI